MKIAPTRVKGCISLIFIDSDEVGDAVISTIDELLYKSVLVG